MPWIERYLFYFVLITKHGAYIDGFAAPQDPNNPDSWACKLVLDSKPQYLREFWLCDIDDDGYALLEKMARSARRPKKHRIETRKGDFNVTVHEILRDCGITDKTASFCLLDQRMFECHWDTVRTLAEFKAEGPKIELFYFLATGWLDRSMAGTKDLGILDRWWGGRGWSELRGRKAPTRAQIVAERFKTELGYAYAYAFPIYDRSGSDGRRIMYYMIHATDHPEAPKLMNRAYLNATKAREPMEQLQGELDALWPKHLRPTGK